MQERFDELDNIKRTLEILVDEITDKNYKDSIMQLIIEIDNEMDIINNELVEERRIEEEELERQYYNSVL